MQLRKHKGDDCWDEKMGLYEDGEKVEAFVARKLEELEAYYDLVDEVEPYNTGLENGEMKAEEYIAAVSPLLGPDTHIQSEEPNCFFFFFLCLPLPQIVISCYHD